MSDDVKIAGNRTVKDWQQFRQTLGPGDDPKVWKAAFETYFEARLTTRYLKPIESLQARPHIERRRVFDSRHSLQHDRILESTLQGRTYRFRRKKDPPLGQYEYTESGQMFTAFLVRRKPFRKCSTRPSRVIFIQVSVRASAGGTDKGRLDHQSQGAGHRGSGRRQEACLPGQFP